MPLETDRARGQFVLMRSIYTAHLQRVIGAIPEHEDLVRKVLLGQDFVEKASLILAMKSDQVLNDREYHSSGIGFPIPRAEPSFAVFEIGCVPSFDVLRDHWTGQGYESYRDYAIDILQAKGIQLFRTMTGEQLPDDLSEADVSRFLFGHILRVLIPHILITSVLWLRPTGRSIMCLPSELVGLR